MFDNTNFPWISSLSTELPTLGDMMRDAIRRRASFNVIHIPTMMKVDIFVLAPRLRSRSLRAGDALGAQPG